MSEYCLENYASVWTAAGADEREDFGLAVSTRQSEKHWQYCLCQFLTAEPGRETFEVGLRSPLAMPVAMLDTCNIDLGQLAEVAKLEGRQLADLQAHLASLTWSFLLLQAVAACLGFLRMQGFWAFWVPLLAFLCHCSVFWLRLLTRLLASSPLPP